MSHRAWAAVASSALVLALLLLPVSPAIGLLAAVPAAIGWAFVVAWAILRPSIGTGGSWWTALPGGASLAATGFAHATGYRGSTDAGMWGLVEVAALLVLLTLVVRWNRGRGLWVSGIVTAVAQIAWISRFIPDEDVGAVLAGCALWGLGSASAVVIGGYPRFAARRTERMVEAEKSRQKRQLERDLHDYVAHDLSGIIAQAQAAQFVRDSDPERLLAALRRVEEAGLRAMSSMDRALELLSGDDPGSAETKEEIRRPDMRAVESLVESFRQVSEDVDVRLLVDGDVATLPREVSETAYRVTMEALTNIRRHAKNRAWVRVEVRMDPSGGLFLRVENAAPRGPSRSLIPRRRGGTGLREVRARTEALGGTLSAGASPSGWRVSMNVPSRRTPR
ncbi:histidine kinase [Nonomuraea sp. NPDC048916]|uniref:sensor histidine kinase n=1 Tax=Nonomuraea sp. NPDC048916 TaxID=3154232 RepID=UPI0033F97287